MTTVIECHPPVVAKRPASDLKAIKAKQQAAWSSGDYAVIGTTLQIVGERLAEAMDLRAGQTARRRSRQRQRHAGRRPALVRGHIHRLCRVAARARLQARRIGRASGQIPGG